MSNGKDVACAVAMLFHEKPEQTIEAIQSIASSKVPVYVVDNGSSAESRAAVVAACQGQANVAFVSPGRNLGVSGGRNCLIQHSREPWLLFIDSDIVVVTPDWLARIREHIERSPNIEVFICRVYNKHEDRYSDYPPYRLIGRTVTVVEDHAPGQELLTNRFPGGASFVSRRLFERLGMYDDAMFVGYEDFELALRALRAQVPVRAQHVEDILLVHEHRPAVTAGDRAAVRTRYDIETHHVSFRRLCERNGVEMHDDYEPWLRLQAGHMLNGVSYHQPARRNRARYGLQRLVRLARRVLGRRGTD